MGVERSDWIVIGANIGYENVDNDDWDFYDHYNGQCKLGETTFIIDGMSGEYFIVGEVLLHADEYEGFGLNEFPLIEASEFNESSERVKSFVLKYFGIEVEPKLIVLTHWH